MKISVYIATSLDGYIAREDGSLDWLPGSDGETANGDNNEDYGYHAFMDSIDVLIMGRNTYEMVAGFGPWPYGEKKVIVLSKTLKELPAELPDVVELTSCSPGEIVKRLEASGYTHAYIDGGQTIQGFLKADLISEVTITRVPVVIGGGIPLFGPLEKDYLLKHIETRSFDTGFVQSRYEMLKK